jgi:pilus assembly protein Flp/PilA
MNKIIAKLMFAVDYLKSEEGQDLVEYALVVALIAFAATAGMNTLAKDINAVFVSLGSELTAATA